MYRSCLKYASYLFCLSFSLTALATETGDMEIKSGLNQKFNAEIPLNIDPADNGRTQYRIIQKKNPVNGLDGEIKPEINLSNDGSKLKLSSQQVLQDPRVNLVLEIRNPEGVQYKQYTADLSQVSDYQSLIVSPIKQRLARKNSKNAKKPALASVAPTKASEKTPATLGVATSESKTVTATEKTPQSSQPSPAVLHTLPATTEPASSPSVTSPAAISTQNPAAVDSAPKETSGISLWLVIAAFIGGIFGVMGLQKLFNRKPTVATDENAVHPNQDILDKTPVAEPFNSAAPTLAALNQEAPLQESQAQFERLLEAKRQEMAAMEQLRAQAETVTSQAPVASNSLEEEDNYGFDFDLPEFKPKQDS